MAIEEKEQQQAADEQRPGSPDDEVCMKLLTSRGSRPFSGRWKGRCECLQKKLLTQICSDRGTARTPRPPDREGEGVVDAVNAVKTLQKRERIHQSHGEEIPRQSRSLDSSSHKDKARYYRNRAKSSSNNNSNSHRHNNCSSRNKSRRKKRKRRKRKMVVMILV